MTPTITPTITPTFDEDADADVHGRRRTPTVTPTNTPTRPRRPTFTKTPTITPTPTRDPDDHADVDADLHEDVTPTFTPTSTWTTTPSNTPTFTTRRRRRRRGRPRTRRRRRTSTFTPTVTPTSTDTPTSRPRRRSRRRTKTKSFLDLPRDPLVRPGERPRTAWPRCVRRPTPAPKWGPPAAVAVVAMAGGGAARVRPRGAPRARDAHADAVPVGSGGLPPLAVHAALGPAVAPRDAEERARQLRDDLQGLQGAGRPGRRNDWPDPITTQRRLERRGRTPARGTYNRAAARPRSTTAAYDHDCDDLRSSGLRRSASSRDLLRTGWAGRSRQTARTDPGIWYPIARRPDRGRDEGSERRVVDWPWTLNYGYGKSPANDIIYGLDPGPPFPVYDMTADPRASCTLGSSIPGITGTPLDVASAPSPAFTNAAQPGGSRAAASRRGRRPSGSTSSATRGTRSTGAS